ncbi:MAG: MFS transporter [Sphingobacteriia bacterium 35-40-5]|nr:MAG: MFS transporter [Sphingobacteriia bacterium 35-40-5]
MSKAILPTIVVSQFLCTSLWFAGNAVMPDLIQEMGVAPQFLAQATSAVQLGFVAGTLVFALLSLSDRFAATKVYLISACVAAAFNLGLLFTLIDSETIFVLRFGTGFFLAGIYPLGMKIAADHFKEKLSAVLGWLVGALVLGTAFPHLVKSFMHALPWQWVFASTSALAILGGLLMFLFVKPNKPAATLVVLKFNAFLEGFRLPAFRSSAFGYFGHMWELYTFWAFVPWILQAWNQFTGDQLNIPLYSFLIIAIGFPACVMSGQLSLKYGAKLIASIALACSGICCLVSPLFLQQSNPILFLGFLFFWSTMVIADSPLFSSLVAKHAPTQSRGSALTIVNCIGFTITILSILTIQQLSVLLSPRFLYLVLAIGPVLGLIGLHQKQEP